MSKLIPDSLTRDEVAALGIDPDHPFCSPRTRTDPIDIRYGDSRVVRSRTGGITHFFGYYSDSQTRTRRLMGEVIAAKLRAACPSLFMAQQMKSGDSK